VELDAHFFLGEGGSVTLTGINLGEFRGKWEISHLLVSHWSDHPSGIYLVGIIPEGRKEIQGKGKKKRFQNVETRFRNVS